ncbi:hypothetical protein CLV62_1181, partial [Dysgonomonas alginatilytica]
MAQEEQQFNLIKITDLPQASTTEGLVTIGVDNTSKSVQVSIEQLKGNKGDTGDNGKDGATPTIGVNGNWFVGNIDTGKPARGEDGNNLSSKSIYNVSLTTGNYAYADKTTARNAVTTTLRALGQIIIYSYGSNEFVSLPFTNIGNYVINAATGVQAASPNHIAHSAAIPTGTKQIELQVFTSSANGGAFFNAS